MRIPSVYWKVRKVSAFSRHQPRTGVFLKYLMCQLYFNVSKGLFTWSGGTRSSGVGFFCFVSARAWKQKKPTPLDRGPPLHVNRVLVVNCMCCISILFRVNRLSFNLKKTIFIVFKPYQKRTNQDIQLLIDGQKIDQVKETVYLGVYVDENLVWNLSCRQQSF